MKWPKLNGVIFGINLGVLAAIAYSLYTRAPLPELPVIEDPAPQVATPAPAAAIEKVVKETVVVTNELHWRQLESEDYKDYITRLRSIGCPEQTIRDIIIADLDKLYAPRVQGLQGHREDLQYWQSAEEELANDVNHPAKQQQERALDREKARILEELLGIDLVRERLKQKGQEDYYERRLAFLPESKRGVVRNLLEDYTEQEQAIRNKEMETGEPITPAEKAELQRLSEQRHAALSATLSPAELEQMELWISPSANAVRHDMYGMNASEEEFQAVYQLRKTFDQQWATLDPELMTESSRADYQQAKAQLDEQIREQLGPQRFADYQRGADKDFHSLSAAVARFNLPRTTSMQVYELKHTLQAVTQQMQNDPNLSEEQKAQSLKAVTDETEKEVRGLMGEKAFKYYLWKGQAYWLIK
jgi:hypothetical protein